ncbi:putative bifunctional diguanylate cyclase/phosphodiesterase [Oricola sp.]|uniref:putative bifunctional diguanylate cyclase/phosphodiesterase n=1 Tax=Oricola sp. TaxID=1979950 RepID=UPI0035159F18
MDLQAQLKLSAFQGLILEAVATDKDFDTVADLLCREAQRLSNGAICTIARIDANGLIRPVSSPSLPESYAKALDGTPIGPEVGSCGTAAYFGVPVQTTDIDADPKWQPYLGLAQPLGLKACWSSPIKTRDGRVVATFAFYFRTKRGATEIERELVSRAVHLCALAYEHTEINARNEFLAYRDQLTGLGNRRSFDTALAEHAAAGKPFGLLLVDIDNLKIVNDSLGHACGDVLINAVAEKLQDLCEDSCAFRMGGDEFAVIATKADSAETLKAMAQSILETATAPVEARGSVLVPGVTIGGVLAGTDGIGPDELRQNADLALYHAKETNRGDFLRFDPMHKTAIIRRLDQSRDLAEALDEDRVMPYFQPVVRLDTGKICGVEALARIRSRDGRVIEAADFHLAFSDSRNASRLTARMLELAADAFQKWQAEDLPIEHMALNLSMADFQTGDLDERLAEAFGSRGIALHHLNLEVTESVLMETHIVRPIDNLRRRGVTVALDDFGTGFASLTHLVNFPVDAIKIDRSFVERFLTDRPSAAIVEALTDIGRKIGLEIVAEGVETVEQANRLTALGCQYGQGYLFARPLDAAAITQLLRVGLAGHAVRPTEGRKTA